MPLLGHSFAAPPAAEVAGRVGRAAYRALGGSSSANRRGHMSEYSAANIVAVIGACGARERNRKGFVGTRLTVVLLRLEEFCGPGDTVRGELVRRHVSATVDLLTHSTAEADKVRAVPSQKSVRREPGAVYQFVCVAFWGACH